MKQGITEAEAKEAEAKAKEAEAKAKEAEAKNLKNAFLNKKINEGSIEGKEIYLPISFPLQVPILYNDVLYTELTVKPLTGFHIMSADEQKTSSQREYEALSKLIGKDEDFLATLSAFDLTRLLKIYDFYYLDLKKFFVARAVFLREAWEAPASQIYTDCLSAKS